MNGAVGAGIFLLGALAVSLAPQFYVAKSTVPIKQQSVEEDYVAPLLAAGTPSDELVLVPEAPLLPGGERALKRVLEDARYRTDETLVVSDSATETMLDYHRPAQRRLRFVARSDRPERARALADAAATAYTQYRRRFFEEPIQGVAAIRSAAPAKRRAVISPTLRAAAVAARRELDRLGRASPAVSVAGAGTPSPLRAGIVAALVALIARRIVSTQRTH